MQRLKLSILVALLGSSWGCAATCDDACTSIISCTTTRQEGYGPILSGQSQDSCTKECKSALAAQKISDELIDCLAQADGECETVSSCN